MAPRSFYPKCETVLSITVCPPVEQWLCFGLCMQQNWVCGLWDGHVACTLSGCRWWSILWTHVHVILASRELTWEESPQASSLCAGFVLASRKICLFKHNTIYILPPPPRGRLKEVQFYHLMPSSSFLCVDMEVPPCGSTFVAFSLYVEARLWMSIQPKPNRVRDRLPVRVWVAFISAGFCTSAE